MQNFVSSSAAAAVFAVVFLGCGEPPLTVETNQEPNQSQVEPADDCAAWCLGLGACGLMGYEVEECAAFCREGLGADHVTTCVECLDAVSCQELDATCLAAGGACAREASVSYLVNVSGWDAHEEVGEGSLGYGQLLRWDGEPVGAFAEGDVSSGGLGLEFGTVLVPGFSYVLQYFIDVDEDGACDASVDLAFEAEIHLKEPVVLTYGIETAPESPDGRVCEDFTSTAALCEARCDHLDACGTSPGTREACVASCEEELSAAFLYRCVSCLDRFTCAEQEAACLQIGGVCNEDYVPPSAEYLFGGSGFGDYDGYEVTGVLQDLAGQDVTSRLNRTIEGGGFFMHFGMSIWPNQDYQFVFFIDDDGSGTCSAGNPGWVVEQEIGDVLLHYQLHEQDPEAVQDVCERLE